MPSRRNQAEETPPETRRSSMRRLSSIASLQTLMNPFNRRRSNFENSPSATTSNISLSSSTVANAPDRTRELNRSDISAESDGIDRVPPLPVLSSRRSSYICLPDDPIGGMPRSRTFSNLPIPTRAKKTMSKLQQSKSHARLPMQTEKAPPSRLPTPTFGLRKHSTSSRLVAVDDKTRKKLVRSDTEPLLQNTLQREASVPRMTAFKENISLSPIKPLSPYDDNIFASTSRQGWSEDSDNGVPLFTERKSSLANQQRKELPKSSTTTRRMSQKFESSPAYRSSRERPPTPGKPVQRWNSQPVLTNTTNVRNSYGTAIKQTRLMSARQAPTPPPTKSPSTEFLLNSTRARGFSNSSSHIRLASSQTSVNLQERPQQISRARAESIKLKPGAVRNLVPFLAPPMLTSCQVLTAQPVNYWTGRFSSLNDRYRNEELTATDISGDSVSKSQTDKLHTTEANSLRMRRAVEHLFSLCASAEAEQSFFLWQKAVANALSMPELAKPMKGNFTSIETRSCALEMSLRSDESSYTSPSDPRKASFMDRLMGRKQKMGLYGDRPSMAAPVVGGFF